MYSIVSSYYVTDFVDFGPDFKVSHIAYQNEDNTAYYIVISEKTGKNKRTYYVKKFNVESKSLENDIRTYPYSSEKEAHQKAKTLAST